MNQGGKRIEPRILESLLEGWSQLFMLSCLSKKHSTK
jgi:hypothetical protein